MNGTIKVTKENIVHDKEWYCASFHSYPRFNLESHVFWWYSFKMEESYLAT